MTQSQGGKLPILRLGGLTAAALFIHGYHLGVEDAEIYVPTAKKLLHPALYPYASEFFLSHGHLSLFGPILAWTSRLTHLPIDWTIFAWYILTLFGMLTSCWFLLKACFSSPRARWCAMLVVTAVLAMPATNTGLLLIDPYLTARSFSTPLTLFALTGLLERKYVLAGVATVLTAAVPSPDGRLPHLPGLRALGGRTQRNPRARTGAGAGRRRGPASHRLLFDPRQRTLPRGPVLPRLLLSLQLDLVSLGRHAGSPGDPGLVLAAQLARNAARLRVASALRCCRLGSCPLPPAYFSPVLRRWTCSRACSLSAPSISSPSFLFFCSAASSANISPRTAPGSLRLWPCRSPSACFSWRMKPIPTAPGSSCLRRPVPTPG